MKKLFALAIAIAVAIFLLMHFVFPAFADTLPAPDTNAVPSISFKLSPITDPVVAGYYLCYGYGSGPLTNRIDVGRATTVALVGIPDGTNYNFGLITYTTARAESSMSTFIAWTNYRVELTMTVLTLSSNGVSVLSITNPLGDNFFCLSNNMVVALNEPTQSYLGTGSKKFVKIKLTPKFYYKITP